MPISLITLMFSHPDSSRANDLGREFITGFMQNTNSTEGANNLKLIITAFSGPTSVNINITSTSTQWTVSLQEGETRAVTVPQSAEMIGSARFPSSILITSDKDISVVSVSEKLQSAGTAVLLPVSKLGTQYYVLTPTGTRRCSHKQFSVINHKFSNKVILSFRQHVTFTEDMYVPKKKLVLTLEPYQALQLQSQEDLSGTKVVSEMPVAVLSGHTCMWQGSMCDHVYEQLPPVSRWKKSFLVPPLVAQYKSDSAYVLAGRKSTQLRYVSGHVKYNTKLERGEVLEILVKPLTPVFISASEPIQVFYYHSGGISQSQQVGSFFISLSGTSEFCKSYNVYGLANFENSAALVANTSASGGVTLDDQPLSNIQWRRIPGTDYSWAVVNFDTARNSHTLKHPGAAFEVLNIGTVTQRAYGTSAICTEGMCE
ncbi:hypothetical protein NDU88_010648 [Pleurodeles waltl]|uniref:IgGFc-binding protein N-terminal domain-containing protein n=1 Tax=Pleurodeles waltl TaxID=8319 RepID=A0AAV7PYJ3_PLEWA|nr:hypothetical protein NDU88_010648 [Pleurodeles waltl]